MGENTCKSCVSHRENPGYIKNSYNSTVKNSFFLNGKEIWIDASPKDKQRANKHLERCSTTLTIKETQI